MKTTSIYLVLLIALAFSSAKATDLYWIGNGGNWSDGTRWSLTSGGSSFNGIPTKNDNVYFDANSFGGGGQTVTINQEAFCKSMNWTGATNTPTLGGSSTLNIYGSMILNSAMNVTYTGTIYFKSNNPGNIIQTFGKTLLSGQIFFDGLGGEWTLQDNLTATNSDISLDKGSFNTNSKTVSAHRFQSISGGICFLTLGASTFNLKSSGDNYLEWGWYVSGSNITVNTGTSTINLTGAAGYFRSYYITGEYYNVNLTGATSGSLRCSDNTVFHNVSFASDASLSGAATFNDITLGTSKSTSISGKQTINGNFICNGTASIFASINGGTISKSSGTVCINYVNLNNSTVTGGATFYAGNSQNLGGNTGWLFQSCSSIGNPPVVFPKIVLSTSSINTGQSISIWGIDFAKNKQAKIFITSNSGYDTTITISIDNVGNIDKTLSFTASGIYTVYCKDVSSGNLSNSKTFEVKATVVANNFTLISPSSAYSANINKNVLVQWKDNLARGSGYPITGSQRAFKFFVEKSSNNGSIWQVTDTVSGFDDINKTRTFSKQVTFATHASYLLRIRDGYASNRTTGNVSLQILAPTQTNLTTEFVWDYSYLTRDGSPAGVVTDGTSRFYIKVYDKTNTTINKVTFKLFDVDNNTETRILGKLQKAIDTLSYDTLVNSANKISEIITTPFGNNEFWSWYVAPDDFIGNNTQNNSTATGREVKVKITAEYSGGATSIDTATVIIKRPPVVLVHGLNDNIKLWDDFNLPEKFDVHKLKIGGKDNFDKNANLILSLLPNVIREIRKTNVACNQVYYVGHSMGGIVLRYAETYYANIFFTQKNYNKGYVNKFITLDTPHKGSPLANLLGTMYKPYKLLNKKINLFEEFYLRDDKTDELVSITPAVNDLKMNLFNINSTFYKSHVFVGDIINGSESLVALGPDALSNLNIDSKIYSLFSFLAAQNPLPTLSGLGVIDFFYNLYGGNSITNSDLIVPLNSQLSDLEVFASNVTYTINFHSETTGSPSIVKNPNTKTLVSAWLDKPIASAYWGNLPALQKANASLLAKSKPQKYFADSNFVNIITPHSLDTLYVDSTFNLAFSIADTTNLKKLFIVYQDKFIEDTTRQMNYNYSTLVSNNYIDTQQIIVVALFSSGDATIMSGKSVSVIVKTNENANAIKSKDNFVYLLKDENYYPDLNIYFQKFIGKIGTVGTSLNVTVGDPSILSFDNLTKKIKGLKEGGTYVVVDYKGLKDTVYFKINGNITTGVDENGNNSASSHLPDKYGLFQNYPNPFNPITTITYSLPKNANVKLIVFDILGRQVRTLIDEQKSAGSYKVEFNASNLSSGVYFYRLQTDEFVQTKKLILLR